MMGAIVQLDMELIGISSRTGKGLQDLRLLFGVEGTEVYEWRLST
jgi:hypothetical protein